MIPGLLLGISMWGATANAAQSAITCDRECLRGKVTQLLYAFLKHDVSEIPVADTLRVTEDAVDKPLAKVGLVRTVTRLRGFARISSTSARAWLAPTWWWRRAERPCEVELVATRSLAEGLSFNIDRLSAPSEVMNYAPRPEQLSTRDEAIKAALHYPAGLNAARTFADVDAPFAAGTSRYENAALMAGPACKFTAGCQNSVCSADFRQSTQCRVGNRSPPPGFLPASPKPKENRGPRINANEHELK
jgi:hypothetical protein